MTRFFKYEDPELAAHVEKIVGLAKDLEENETIVRDFQKRPKEYTLNNRLKAFAPMTSDDLATRNALGESGGKGNFVVDKHRAEQKKKYEEYDNMACDRDIDGTFHVSAGQMSKVAQAVVDVRVKEQKNMSFFERIKEAISLSEVAKKKRANLKALKEAAKKG